MPGHRRAEATPSFGRLCPDMTAAKSCYITSMRFSLTTWNINSVRLRIDIVAKFLKTVRPDVLCLQETKCIDDAFPLKRFKRLGYDHCPLTAQQDFPRVPT